MVADVLTTTTDLDEIAPAWRALVEQSSNASVFQTHGWTRTWWQCFGAGKRLAVVVVRDAGEIVGIAPLVLSRWEGFRHLGFVGSELADYEDFVIHDDADRSLVLRTLASAIASLDAWDCFVTNRMRADSPNLAVAPGAFAQIGPLGLRSRHFGVAPRVVISTSWEEYEASLAKRLRSDSRRQSRRLSAELGPIAFRKPTSEEDVETLVAIAVRQHRERRGKRDYSRFERPAMVDFYRSLGRCMRRAGLLELEALEAGGRTVAVHFGLRHRGRFYYWLPTMDDENAKYSPGRLLLLHLLEQSFRQGDSEFDLLLGDEAYKADFATDHTDVVSLEIYADSVRGRAARAWFSYIRPSIRRSAKAAGLGPWLRRRGIVARAS